MFAFLHFWIGGWRFLDLRLAIWDLGFGIWDLGFTIYLRVQNNYLNLKLTKSDAIF